MIKSILSILCTSLLLCCRHSIEPVDYLGQSYPDSIPTIFGPDIVSLKGRLEHGISFTPDTKALAFGVLNADDFSGKIHYAEQSKDTWSNPEVFEPLKDENVFLPYFSPDGKSLLYAQSRPDTISYLTDIWRLQKNKTNWNRPEKVNDPISTATREATACMTKDNTIYFSSNRDGNGLADLYVSSLENRAYSKVERIDAISSERDEESIFVSPNADYIIFSRYATDENGPDLFISYRDSKGNWGEPRALNAAINTSDWERRPFVSMENKFLFFTKLTFDQSGLTESDIYWVNTEKVFKPYVFNAIAEKTVRVGEKTEIKIPSDYFKDIDDEKLKIRLKNEKIEWAELDVKKMTLVIHPKEIGEFELFFTAVDSFSNETEDSVKIRVEE